MDHITPRAAPQHNEVLPAFDYDALDGETYAIVRRKENDILELAGNIGRDAIAIGLALIVAKSRLKHGMFMPWISARLHMSYSTANRLMRVGSKFGNCTSREHFEVAALFLLAETQTPDEAVEDARRIADAGGRVTRAVAAGLVGKYQSVTVDSDSQQDLHDDLLGSLSPARQADLQDAPRAEAAARERTRTLRRQGCTPAARLGRALDQCRQVRRVFARAGVPAEALRGLDAAVEAARELQSDRLVARTA